MFVKLGEVQDWYRDARQSGETVAAKQEAFKKHFFRKDQKSLKRPAIANAA